MRRRSRVSCAVFALGMSGVLHCAAAPELQTEPLCFAAIDIPPFVTPGASPRGPGLVVQLAGLLQARSGVRLQVQAMPLVRLVRELREDRCDLALVLPSSDFGPGVQVLGDLGPLDVWLLPRKGLNPLPKAPLASASLVGLRVASFGGGTVWNMVAPLKPATHVRVSSSRSMLGMLHANRVDLAVGVRQALEYGLADGGYQREDFAPPIVVGRYPMQLHAASRVPQPAREALTRALAELRDGPEVRAILDGPSRPGLSSPGAGS